MDAGRNSTTRSQQDTTSELNNLEAEIIVRHAEMFAELNKNSKEVDKFERRKTQYQRDVRNYDAKVKAFNSTRLAAFGGTSQAFPRTTTLATEPVANPLPLRVLSAAKVHNSQVDIRNGRNGPEFGVALPQLISTSTAAALIEISEHIGYRTIVKNISSNYAQTLPERTNRRCVVHDTELAQRLWQLLAQHVPPIYTDRAGDWVPCRVNECFRFCKYDAGQLFAAHVDDVYRSRDGTSERSFLTVVLYLNEGYEGGKLRFLKTRGAKQSNNSHVLLEIQPSTGLCMIFQHDLLHDATPPTNNVSKFLVRTDIVYARKRW
jgi:predicted 2-oxoglutarate/Fe(II)-dependent dioxygenase YbiX